MKTLEPGTTSSINLPISRHVLGLRKEQNKTKILGGIFCFFFPSATFSHSKQQQHWSTDQTDGAAVAPAAVNVKGENGLFHFLIGQG